MFLFSVNKFLKFEKISRYLNDAAAIESFICELKRNSKHLFFFKLQQICGILHVNFNFRKSNSEVI
jgi:hypothetical protein